jgi:hypothetical protein
MSFNLSKYAYAQNLTISGAAVDELISVINMMYGRGAPVQWDYTGFNKIDYGHPVLQSLYGTSPGSEVSVADVVTAMRILHKYKNTQLPQYDELANKLQQLIASKTGTQVPAQQSQQAAQQTNKVAYVGTEYNKPVFHIPGLGLKVRKIRKAIANVMEENGLPTQDVWKMFSASKKGIDFFIVDPEYIDVVKPILVEKGYDVSEMVVPQNIQKQISTKTIEVNLKDTSQGFTVYVKFIPYNPRLVAVVKQTKQRRYQDKVWALFNPDPQLLTELAQEGVRLGYDVAPLTEVITKMMEKADETPEAGAEAETKLSKFPLRVQDVYDSTNGQWQIGFGFLKKGTEEGEMLKEIIKFSFPNYGEKADSQRFVDKNTWLYYVKGNYGDYRRLHDIFVRYGFDTSKFDAIVAGLINRGVVEIDLINGDLDGFQTEYMDSTGKVRKKNQPKRFYEYLENEYEGPIEKGGRTINFEFYPAQKEGVAFLYGREAALLGDSTGVGKCLAAGSFVQTNLGLFEIQDIWNKFARNISSRKPNEEWAGLNNKLFVHSIDSDNKVVKGQIERLYRERFKGKLLKYKTSNGKEIITTKAHRFLTPCGWKNSLTIGDRLCSSSNQFRLYNKPQKIDKNLA